jgi:hypothetical protein
MDGWMDKATVMGVDGFDDRRFRVQQSSYAVVPVYHQVRWYRTQW